MAAKDEDERIEFVRLVAKLKDKRALEFLVNEAREGPLPRPRVQAAWQLASRGRLDGIAPLIELWRASARSGDSHPESLINVLAMTDSPDGIRALAEGLRRRSDAGRSRVLQALEPEYRPFALMHLGDYERKDGASLPLSAASAAAVEDLLVSELDDPGEYHGSFGHRDRKRLCREPMCDEAAWLLQSRWPDRYAFDIAASYPTRTRQRIAGVNTWREAHGRPLLPLPSVRAYVAVRENS